MSLAIGAFAGRRLLARDSEFWEKKAPDQWTSDEIDQMLTRSPWAKQVNAESGSSQGQGGGGRGGLRLPGGIGFPGGGMGGGGMGRGRGGDGGRGGGASQQMKGTVRWESAQPVLEALKTKLPDSMANRYVISVSGFPLGGGRRGREEDSEQDSTDEMLERLKSFTLLQPKGKALAQPGVVERQRSMGGASLLFGFGKDLVVLDRDDSEVEFATHLGRMTVKTKFNLKQMLYHGQLAV